MADPSLSLIVSTLGRAQELLRLFASLERQTWRDFEVIIVDQNDDSRLDSIVLADRWSFPLTHMRRPGTRGLSRGRNEGWRAARGEIILFPDDDCWYPVDLLERAMSALRETNAAILSGRAADETGRSINGRFETTAMDVTRDLVWTCQIEWMMFIRASTLRALNGYDENVGVGADTPWQSAEGQDLTLRALDIGLPCRYDPSLTGHHAELNTATPDGQMIRKGRQYARGMGYVLRKSGHGWSTCLYWVARPIARAALSLMRLRMSQFRYYKNVALGRWEGYRARTIA